MSTLPVVPITTVTLLVMLASSVGFCQVQFAQYDHKKQAIRAPAPKVMPPPKVTSSPPKAQFPAKGATPHTGVPPAKGTVPRSSTPPSRKSATPPVYNAPKADTSIPAGTWGKPGTRPSKPPAASAPAQGTGTTTTPSKASIGSPPAGTWGKPGTRPSKKPEASVPAPARRALPGAAVEKPPQPVKGTLPGSAWKDRQEKASDKRAKTSKPASSKGDHHPGGLIAEPSKTATSGHEPKESTATGPEAHHAHPSGPGTGQTTGPGPGGPGSGGPPEPPPPLVGPLLPGVPAIPPGFQDDSVSQSPSEQWGEHSNEPVPPGNQLAESGISDLPDPALRQAWENARGLVGDKADLRIDPRFPRDLYDKIPSPDATCHKFVANVANIQVPDNCNEAQLQKGIANSNRYNAPEVAPPDNLPQPNSLPEKTIIIAGKDHSFIVKDGKLVEFTKPAPTIGVPGRGGVTDSLGDIGKRQSPRATFEAGPGDQQIQKPQSSGMPYKGEPIKIYKPKGTTAPTTPPGSPPATPR